MPPALAMCLCLVGALFSGALVGLSYGHLKLPNPSEDGYFKLQADIADRMGLERWAATQRSKAARWASFIGALLVFVACLIGAVWFGAAAFFASS